MCLFRNLQFTPPRTHTHPLKHLCVHFQFFASTQNWKNNKNHKNFDLKHFFSFTHVYSISSNDFIYIAFAFLYLLPIFSSSFRFWRCLWNWQTVHLPAGKKHISRRWVDFWSRRKRSGRKWSEIMPHMSKSKITCLCNFTCRVRPRSSK